MKINYMQLHRLKLKFDVVLFSVKNRLIVSKIISDEPFLISLVEVNNRKITTLKISFIKMLLTTLSCFTDNSKGLDVSYVDRSNKC